MAPAPTTPTPVRRRHRAPAAQPAVWHPTRRPRIPARHRSRFAAPGRLHHADTTSAGSCPNTRLRRRLASVGSRSEPIGAHRNPDGAGRRGRSPAVAAARGPTLGALVVEWVGWRWVFYLNIPIGLYAVVVGSPMLVESKDPNTRLPAPLGVALIAGAAALLSFGVVQSESWGWSDTRTVASLGLGLVALVGFVASQRKSQAPVLDLELFAIRNFAWGNAASMVFGLAFIAMFFGSILFLTDVWDWSVLAAGSGIAPGPLLVAILAPQMGRLAGRFGQRPLLIAGGVFFAIGGLWRLAFLGPQVDYLFDYLPSMNS
ncbi:MAG: MFS transporter [Acidimicrobiales bacterium]